MHDKPAEPPAPIAKEKGVLRGLRRGGVDAATTYVLQFVSLGLGFISQVMVARLAGASGYGAYAYALAWSSVVVQPSILGFDRVLLRELATYSHTRAFGLMRGLLRRADQVALLAGGVFMVVIAVIALPISSSSLRVPVALGLITIPLAALSRVRLAALQGLKRASLGQLTQSVGRTVYFIVFLGIAVAISSSSHLGPEAAVMMQVLAFAAAAVSGSIALRRVLPAEARQATPEFDGRVWARSLPPLALMSVMFVLNSQIGVIMLGAMESAADAGVFNAASRGAALVSLGMIAVGQVLAPRIAILYASGDRAGIQRLIARGTRAASAVALPTSLFLVLAGPWFLGLFGDDFRGGSSALTILAVGQLLNAATGAVVPALVMTKHERPAAVAAVSGTCLNAALCAILIPVWGSTGAATATAASVVLINVLFMVAVVRKLRIRPVLFGISLPGSRERHP